MDTQQEQVNNEVETEQVEATEPSTEATEVEPPVIDEIQVPDNWESDVKDFINSIQDQSGKKAIFDKISNYERGYQKKYQDLATQRKQMDADRVFLDNYRGFENSLDPEMKALILSRYGNVPSYMNALHQMDIVATKDPVQFVRNFCMNNNITADQVNGILSDKQYQQMESARSQDTLRAEILQEIRQEQQKERMQDAVNRFVEEVNPDGTPKHPLLQNKDFVEDMDKLGQAFPNKSLEELYQMALSFRPELRQEAIRVEAERIEKAKEVEKAKSVMGVKAKVPVSNAQEQRGWRSTLNDELNPYEV